MDNSATHEHYLQQALALANERRGFCAPNPAVAAILVKDGRVLASGVHQGSGTAHAEVLALQQAGTAAHGAQLYVTLEPCCHIGKMPPCTASIIAAGVKEVIYAYQDIDPRVAGRAMTLLQAAGVDVCYYPMPAMTEFYRSYRYWMQHRRPWLTAKLAMSLDGKIATAGGGFCAITGDCAKQYTYQGRLRADALLTTAVTLNQDNPRLDVRLRDRLGDQIVKKPVYVIDSQLMLSPEAQIFSTAARVTIFHQEDVAQERRQCLEARGASCVPLPATQGQLALPALMDYLGEAGLHDVWLEAGGSCVQACLRAGLVQRFLLYIAPKYLGADALAAFDARDNLLAGVRQSRWQVCGDDVVCDMYFEK